MADPVDVQVRFYPGEYRVTDEGNLNFSWEFTMPEHSIQFRPLNNDRNFPIFIGSVRESWWFRRRHVAGQRTNLIFTNLQIQDYRTAITIEGDSNESAFCSHNRIYGCIFKRIGNVSFPDAPPSTACVRLQNCASAPSGTLILKISSTSPGMTY